MPDPDLHHFHNNYQGVSLRVIIIYLYIPAKFTPNVYLNWKTNELVYCLQPGEIRTILILYISRFSEWLDNTELPTWIVTTCYA